MTTAPVPRNLAELGGRRHGGHQRDAGYMSAEPRAEFYRHIDAANVDLEGIYHEPLMTARLSC